MNHPSRVLAIGAALVSLSAAGARAQRDLKVIPDPDPELERATFQLADGLEVNLYAADPLLAKPIHMNFDAAGRLWVASSEVYPHVKPGQVASDKIVVLEDADADGVAERTTVFADGLLIPTGVVPGDGGAYVANSTELLHLADTDGDGSADRRRVMLSGFGTEDTHHIIHTFRWGMDGMLYFNQSIYIHSHVETPWGVRRLNSGGVWQFRPETVQLEVFTRGLCNPWGHVFDYWGQSFETDGAGGEGINYVFPGATLFTYAGAKRILNGLNPGSPKHCGLEVISGRHFPADWQGNLITNDFRAHRVCRFVVSEAGAGYASQEQIEVIKSTHGAFRPVDVKLGPDGALYIADWYNPIIQHGEVDFRDERRDHTHGRIWRVTFKDRPLVPRPSIVGASIDELLAMLAAPEEFTRLHAKLELKARGPSEVLPKLAAWIGQLDPADAGFEHARLEALWTYQALDSVEPGLLGELVASDDHRVRAAATRVLGAWRDRLSEPIEPLARLVEDAHPQVRLEAVRALSQIQTPRAADLALAALDHPTDRFLEHALWLAARDLQAVWLAELEAGREVFGGNPRHLSHALAAAGSPRIVAPLVELYAAGKLPPERETSVLRLIAERGEPAHLAVVLERALDPEIDGAQRLALLAALNETARVRKTRPEGDVGAIVSLLDDPDELVRIAAIDASGLWDVAAARDKLAELAEAGATPAAVRRAAMNSLAALGPDSLPTLIALADGQHPAETRAVAIAALAGLDLAAACQRAVQFLQSDTTADPTALLGAIVDRQGGAAALVQALSGAALSSDAAKLAVRAVRSAAREEPELVDALSSAGGITSPQRELSPDALAALVAEVAERGDAARGEAVFRRAEQACLKCHSIAGAGGLVAPDLVSIGASAPVDYLIESILQPSAKIKENYHSYTVVSDGVITSGVRVRETADELVLRDAEDREITIAIDSIEDRKEGGSIMPVGLVDNLTRGELADLVRFLSELGKVGPYAVGNARVARRWQVAVPSPDELSALTFGDDVAATREALSWAPAYATVSGHLDIADLPPGARMLRCQLNVAAGGKAVLNIEGEPARVWLDRRSAGSDPTRTLDLTPGIHTVTLMLAENATGRVRLELRDAPQGTAQVQFVGGK